MSNKKRQSGLYGRETFESQARHYCDVINFKEYAEGHPVPLCVREVPVSAPFTLHPRFTVADHMLINFSGNCLNYVSNYDGEEDVSGGCSDDLDVIITEEKNQIQGGSVSDKAWKSLDKGKSTIHQLNVREFWLCLLGVEWRYRLKGARQELIEKAEFIQHEVRAAGHTGFRCRILNGPDELGEAVRKFYKGDLFDGTK